MDSPWVYPLRNLGETQLDDGSSVKRPVVPLRTRSTETHRGVIDTGSPISVASTGFARRAGVDLDAEPIMEVPLGLGARFERLPIYETRLTLLAPNRHAMRTWTLSLAIARSWHFGFDVLLGQQGWFDTFTTTFGQDRFAVENSDTFDERFGSPGDGSATL